MLGLTITDWFVIFLYLAGITVIGLYAARKVKSAASFFISDRKFGKAMMVFFSFGTGTHSDQAVSVASKTYKSGASGIWYQWLWLFLTPFYWLIAPVFRRMRAVTVSDYFQARYTRSVSVLHAVIGLLQMTVNIGLMLKGAGAMITAVSGGTINTNYAIFGMTLLFMAYGIAGGLNAAIMTDFVQGILTIVLSFLILPFALSAVGGMAGMRETIGNPDMFKIVAPGEITAFYIFIISLNGLIGWVTMPHNMGMCAAGKTEMEGRFGLVTGMFTKRICTVAWVLTGMCAVAMYAGRSFHVDEVYGIMAREILPQIGTGLVGLFIASMLASVMSSCDAFMVSSAALFTENVYKPLLRPGMPDQHYVRVGRIASGMVVVAGILFAYNLESVISGLEIFWKVCAMMGIAFWVGLFWRRATPAGAWAATLVSFAVLLFTSDLTFFGKTVWSFNRAVVPGLPGFMTWEGKLYLPWQMILYLVTGLVTIIAVSLVTRKVPGKKLDRFYECLRTPIAPNEPETEPFTLPDGVTPAPRTVLVDHPDFEIPRPQPISVIGFLVSFAVVGAMVGAVYWIFSLGA
jgi:Na+/proline symporter